VKTLVDELLKEIVVAASKGDEISLPGFGKFKVREAAAREGRNPSTGEIIAIPASRKLSFTPAKAVKDQLNG
jgi:DNA-binding protein HU-beta